MGGTTIILYILIQTTVEEYVLVFKNNDTAKHACRCHKPYTSPQALQRHAMRCPLPVGDDAVHVAMVSDRK